MSSSHGPLSFPPTLSTDHRLRSFSQTLTVLVSVFPFFLFICILVLQPPLSRPLSGRAPTFSLPSKASLFSLLVLRSQPKPVSTILHISCAGSGVSCCDDVKARNHLTDSRQNMVSKALMACWAFVDAWLLAAGVLSLVMSLVWRAPNLLLNFTISNADLTGASSRTVLIFVRYQVNLISAFTAGTVLGIALLITFAISIAAIVQRNHVTAGLVILNWALLFDLFAIIVVGTYIWFFTLQERNNYFERFKAATPDVRRQLQDHVRRYIPYLDLITSPPSPRILDIPARVSILSFIG